MGAVVKLLDGIRAVVMEDERAAHSREPAPEFDVERLLVVLPVQDDPHVDPVVAHRGEEHCLELLGDGVALDCEPLPGVRDPVVGGIRTRWVRRSGIHRAAAQGESERQQTAGAECRGLRYRHRGGASVIMGTGLFGQGVLGLLAIQPPKVKRRASRQPAPNTGSFGIVIGGTSLKSGRDPSVCGVFRPHKGRCSPETLHA